MIKILYVIGQLGVGGAEHQLLYLCQHLNREKFEPLVCSLSEDATLKPLFEQAGIRVVVIPSSMSPDLTRPFKLARLIRSFQPDLVHSYLWVANTWARLVAPWFKTPIILSERSANPSRRRVQSYFDRLIAPLGDFLIANSYAGAQHVIQNKAFHRDKVTVIHNGLPFNTFITSQNSPLDKSIRFQFNIKPQEKIIGIIASLSEHKNHRHLFDSYKILKMKIPDTKLMCIGDGSLKPELQAYAESIGVAQDVIFTGVRNDINHCLAVLDVMVLTSKWEGLPNVLLEAMASGCPVVATNVGGVGEVVLHGETGFLVEPGDAIALAEAIFTVLQGGPEVARITNRASKFIVEKFSIEKMVSQTEKVYQELIDATAQKA